MNCSLKIVSVVACAALTMPMHEAHAKKPKKFSGPGAGVKNAPGNLPGRNGPPRAVGAKAGGKPGKFGGGLPGSLPTKLPGPTKLPVKGVKPPATLTSPAIPSTGKLSGFTKFQKLASAKKPSAVLKPLALGKLPTTLAGVKGAKAFTLTSPFATKAKAAAIKKLGLHPHSHWWVDFCIGWHWHTHRIRWWDHCYTPGYWSCWTTHRYRVVEVPATARYAATSWYLGVDCVLIPDMACYGVQEVQPNSPAAAAGLTPGDMIVSVNGLNIADEGVLQRSIQTSGGVLQLGVLRDGSEKPMEVAVALQQVTALSY